jgi:Arc/MetJ-type ribon-helix-helix transcriptional regulator
MNNARTEEIMATMTFELTDAAKEFMDREIASGRFKDVNSLVEIALMRLMAQQKLGNIEGFSEEEKKRIDHMLDEAVASFARGDYAVVRPGEFKELAQRLVDQHQKKQAS